MSAETLAVPAGAAPEAVAVFHFLPGTEPPVTLPSSCPAESRNRRYRSAAPLSVQTWA
jgi:hypothetical protein